MLGIGSTFLCFVLREIGIIAILVGHFWILIKVSMIVLFFFFVFFILPNQYSNNVLFLFDANTYQNREVVGLGESHSHSNSHTYTCSNSLIEPKPFGLHGI